MEPPIDPAISCSIRNGFGAISDLYNGSTCNHPVTIKPACKSGNSEQIKLFSMANSRARVFSSHLQDQNSNFNRNTIQEIVNLSIRNGTDPYAALAVFTYENRKKLGEKYSDTRDFLSDSFHEESELKILGCRLRPGKTEELKKQIVELGLSQENITAYTSYHVWRMECLKNAPSSEKSRIKSCNDPGKEPEFVKKLSEEKKGNIRVMTYCSQPEVNCPFISGNGLQQMKRFDLTRPIVETTKKAIRTYGCFSGVQGVMTFEIGSPSTEGKCCVEIFTNSNISKHISLRNHFSVVKIRDDLKISPKEAASLGTNAEKLSLAIQKYNGLGTSPNEAIFENKCLAQINQRRRPVYGAIAADLMYNLFLSSPEIRSMVEQSYKNYNRPQQDQMCLVLGTGTHEYDSMDFVKLQDKYLREDNAVPNRYKICTNKDPKMTFLPWEDEDALKFF